MHVLQVTLLRAACYWVVQFGGAILACALLYAVRYIRWQSYPD